MQRHASLFAKLAASVILLACDGSKLLDPPTGSPDSPSAARAQSQTQFATLTKLPSLGSNSEALGVNDAGTVIVGHSFDRAGMLYAVKWTLQAGSWKITTLPYAGSARAMGAAAAKLFEPVPRRNPEILKCFSRFEQQQLPEHDPEQARRKPANRLAQEHPFGIPVGEAPDHG